MTSGHAGDRTTGYRTIVVGTAPISTISPSSFRAVTAAGRLAGATGALLVLACAYRPMPERERAAAAAQLDDLGYKVAGAAPAESVLRAAREHAVSGGASEIDETAAVGDAVDVLVRVASERDADLVVVGNRGLNSLAGRILGSVPSSLTHRAPCDVLIVRTTDGR
jgi:nucleotide-binding universal stress UspA family protein